MLLMLSAPRFPRCVLPCAQVVVMTHAYGNCTGVRFLTNGLKVRAGGGGEAQWGCRSCASSLCMCSSVPPAAPVAADASCHTPRSHAFPPWPPLAIIAQVYYIPRLPFYAQSTLPTFIGTLRLLRCILLRERITLVHAHQAFSTLGLEALLQARTMGYKVRPTVRACPQRRWQQPRARRTACTHQPP